MTGKSNDNPLGIDMDLKPGIVYFFKAGGTRAARWKRYRAVLSALAAQRGLTVEEVEAPRSGLECYTVARLYNFGNLTRQAYVWISGEYGADVAMASVGDLIDRLVWLESWEGGSIDVTEAATEEMMPAMPCCHSAAAEPAAAKFSCPGSSAGKGRTEKRRVEKSIADKAKTDEDDFMEALEAERRRIMERIGLLVSEYVRRYHEMPPLELLGKGSEGKFIVAPDPGELSPVVVNGNMEIVLPYYNELRLKLTPLARAIYILFLCHPEGIRLKDIGDYREELENIYLLVKPGSDESLAAASVAGLCYPGSDSLNQKISMIRRAVKMQLNMPDLVEHYSITGRRGMAYSIAAASGDVRLPAAVC